MFCLLASGFLLESEGIAESRVGAAVKELLSRSWAVQQRGQGRAGCAVPAACSRGHSACVNEPCVSTAFIPDTSPFSSLPQNWRPTLLSGFLPWVSTKWETLSAPIQSWSFVLKDWAHKQSRWRWVLLLSCTTWHLHVAAWEPSLTWAAVLNGCSQESMTRGWGLLPQSQCSSLPKADHEYQPFSFSSQGLYTSRKGFHLPKVSDLSCCLCW